MTQEAKELLLKDLCARLPYGVVCDIGLEHPLPLQRLFVDRLDGILLDFYEDGQDYQVYLSEVKLYLFPISSMTEEQFNDLKEYTGLKYSGCTLELVEWNDKCKTLEFWVEETPADIIIKVFDWCNENHFDYRGLISRGLAKDATGLNIYNYDKTRRKKASSSTKI